MNNTSTLFDIPGPRGRILIRSINLVGGTIVLVIVGLILWGLAQKGQFEAAKWLPFLTLDPWIHYIFPGIWATAKAALIAIVAANVVGMGLGLGRLAKSALIRAICGILVEFFRAVPVLILMIFFYFFFSSSGLVEPSDSPFWGVVTGLTLYNGSVIAELVRSGITALPRGQREAGVAVGLTSGQCLRLIELPQALIAMMPAMVAQLIVILKDTALGAMVTYPELLSEGRLLGTRYANLLPAFFIIGIIYIVINDLLTRVAGLLNRKLDTRLPRALQPTTGPVEPEFKDQHLVILAEGTELPEQPFLEPILGIPPDAPEAEQTQPRWPA